MNIPPTPKNKKETYTNYDLHNSRKMWGYFTLAAKIGTAAIILTLLVLAAVFFG